jgi:hypothetical protein
MHFLNISHSFGVLNAIVEDQSRRAASDGPMARSLDPDTVCLSSLCRALPFMQYARGKPGFDNDDPSGSDVMAETTEGGHHTIERLEVSDGTEKAQDDIEPPAQFERTHVRLVKLRFGQLAASNPQEAGVEIQAGDIKTMLISKVFGVFACATCDVEDRLGAGMLGADQGSDACRLRFIVFERGIDGVVELSGCREHLSFLPDK